MSKQTHTTTVAVWRKTEDGEDYLDFTKTRPAGEAKTLEEAGSEIVVLDLSQEDSVLVPLLHKALRNIGGFYIIGHGIPQELLDRIHEQLHHLFALPEDVKKSAVSDNISGYTKWNNDRTDRQNQTNDDTRETFFITRPLHADEPRHKFAGDVPWAATAMAPGFRPAMEEWTAQMDAVGLRLARLFFAALAPEDSGAFEQCFQRPIGVTRLLHYSAEKSNDSAGHYACGAHTDFGMFTIVPPDNGVGGLEVYDQEKECWLIAPQMPDAYFINIGDMMQRWTNDIWRACIHRVMNPGTERYSLPYFYHPAADANIEVFSSCCGPDRPARYPATTMVGHMDGSMTKNAKMIVGYDKLTS